MNPAHERALDDCLDRLLNGESVESYRDEITEQEITYLVELAAFARLLAEIPVPVPSAAAVDAGRERMLARLREQKRAAEPSPARIHSNGHKRGFSLKDLKPGKFPIFQAATAFLLIILVSSGFVVSTSAKSLPGEALYPVKIAWEDFRITLTNDSSSQQELKSQFQVERQQEIKQVAQAHRSAQTTYQDVLKRKEPSHWLVGQVWIEIHPDTHLSGDARVGDDLMVTVQIQPDGSTVAETVKVVEPTPGNLAEAATTPIAQIVLSPASHTYQGVGDIAPTPSPAPRSNPRPQKTNPAVASISTPVTSPLLPAVEPSTAVPTSTDTPTPTASATPTVSATPTASASPSATITATATGTGTAIPTPTGTPTQTATATPTASATVTPVSSPTATAQPSATSTALPTATPTPDASSTPVSTDTPTSTPSQTDTPLPAATDTQVPASTPIPTQAAATTVSPPVPTDLPTPTGSAVPGSTAVPTDTPHAPPNTPPASPLISILMKILHLTAPANSQHT